MKTNLHVFRVYNLDSCKICNDLKTCDVLDVTVSLVCPRHKNCHDKAETTTSTTTTRPQTDTNTGLAIVCIFVALGCLVCIGLACIRFKYIW